MIGLVCLLIGFMVATLFNTNKQPDSRDTRDTWEIRTALQEEQKVQQNLYQEIAEAEKTLIEYQEQTEHQQIISLKESIQELREKAGLTEIVGKGMIITIEPIFLNEELQEYPSINAELLQLFINELNASGANEIAIGNQRIINISPIRDVNGKVYVNNSSIGNLPTDIHIITKDIEKFRDYIEVSEINDYFALENVTISIREQEKVVLPKYDGAINLQEVHVGDIPEVGES
ncbi:YlxX protein [Gracilibacillus boraciitolerans JCM 21714]|uniref:YlxX protein n=2 Tax=Gracilibacillus boraciitolerans TaxID=307521 RepID=W4VEU7_9BACI|nr:YlxX protein [Gracilibacillus boraciitolerans JCM 21714]